jgi:hypothetical protein
MGLFDFINKKKKEVPVNGKIHGDLNATSDINIKKFNLLCINYGINDYFFTLSNNNFGRFVINSNIAKDEFMDINKTLLVLKLIESKLDEIITFSKDNLIKQKDNNIIQINYDNKKYTIFRDPHNADLCTFYNEFVSQLVGIVNINKTYENIELDFTFDYSSYWKKIVTDTDSYKLLSSSKSLLVLDDGEGGVITFESIVLKDDTVEKIISNIKKSDEYNVVDNFDYNIDHFKIDFVFTKNNGDREIELFGLISFKKVCVILTANINDDESHDIRKVLENIKFQKIINLVDSLKLLSL